MASRQYSFEEIRALLETTLEDVNCVLFDSSQLHNQHYYQNFSGLSLRSLKYMNIYLNRTSTSHIFGGIIDTLIGKLSDSLTEYKSRNIFIDSLQQRGDEDQRQQDQIYHFMNTRNTLMPLECLSDYQNQKQRKQLQDFVQSMKKHIQPAKESKRSLILPKENKFQLKMGRKATFDPAALPIQHTVSINNTQTPTPQELIGRNDIQTQTELIGNKQNQIISCKQYQIQIPSQCDNYSASESVEDCFSQTKHKGNQIQKKKKKTPYESQTKNKKKAKFNSGNLTSIKQDIHNMHKKMSKIDQSNACSIKVVGSVSCLKLCSRELQISVANYSEEATITVSLCNQTKNTTVASSKNIISYHQMQSQSRLQQNFKGDDAQNQGGAEIKLNQKQSQDQIEQLKQRIRLKYEQPNGNTMQPIHEVTNSFISFSSSYKQNTDHVQQLEDTQINNQNVFTSKAQKTTSLHFQSEAMKIPISSVKILQVSQNRQFQPRQKSQFSNQTKNIVTSEKQSSIRKESIMKKQYSISHPHAFYIEEKTVQSMETSYKNNIFKPSKIMKQRKISEDQPQPSSRAKFQSQSISSVPSQDYLASRQIHTDIKPHKAELKLTKSKLTILRKSQILQGHSAEQLPSSSCTQKLLSISKQKHLRPQSYGNGNGGLFVISNKNRLASEAISRKARDNNYHSNLEAKKNSKKIKFNVEKQQNGLQDKIKENQSAKTSKNSSISEKRIYEIFQRSSQLLSEKLPLKKYSPKQYGKLGQSDCRKSLHQSSCENVIVKKGIRSLQSQIRSHSNSKSSVYYNSHSSSFEPEKQLPIQICQLRSKLRNRAYKNKLAQYLQLIQTTHKKFCGEGCVHLKQLLEGSNGDIAQNILRLFKKLK